MKTLSKIKAILAFNLKTFIVFEIFYRAFGVLLIFPLVRVLFYTSIRVAGYQYITNRMLIEYLTSWTTILFLILLIIIFSVYVYIEMIFLSIIYDFGYHKEILHLKTLIKIGTSHSLRLLLRYKVLILVPAVYMFFVFEALHIVGFASTISIPRNLIEEIDYYLTARIVSYVLITLVLLFFVEMMFYLKLYTIESMSFKDTFKEHRILLKGKRFKYASKFFIYNIALNAIMYIGYTLIILLIALFIFLVRGQEYVLASILTLLYSFYIIATTISTLILIPFNYALVSTWYYDARPKSYIKTKFQRYRKEALKPKNKTILKPIMVGIFVVLLGINITNVFGVVREPTSSVEFLKRAEVIAHRGASLSAPENTLSAIEIAIEQNAEGVEFDVLMTLDGELVLMHDNALGRTTNDPLNRRVDQVSFAEIRTLDAGSWFSEDYVGEKIPTLEEALRLIDGRATAYIDLKTTGEYFNQKVVNLIEELELEDSAVIMSFDYNQLVEIKELNPNLSTLLLISTFFGDIDGLIRDDVIDRFAFRTFVIANNPEFVRQVQRQGKRVYVWTLETEDQLTQFVELDVDGLIAKNPILAREVVYSRNTNSLLAEILKQLFSG